MATKEDSSNNQTKKRSKVFLIVLIVLLIAGGAFGISKYLYSKKDSHIMLYDLDEMKEILGTCDAYSPELSDANNEMDEEGNIYVNICNLLWRSQEVPNF